MVDFHSHILPGVDDGSESVEESIEMLRESKQQGVEAVVVTPHFYADRDTPERFVRRRAEAAEKLRESVAEMDLPKIILASEVSYFEGMSDSGILDAMKIEGTDVVLVEMPAISWNDRMIDEVSAIYEKTGIVPMIAHIDRYIKVFGKKNMADWFEGLPVIIQANSSFFEGWKYSRLALKMFMESKIHVIGSDAHNMTTRAPNMTIAFDALSKRFGPMALRDVEAVEKAVLKGSKKDIFRTVFSR